MNETLIKGVGRLLPFVAAAFLAAACVDDEQAPFSDGAGASGGGSSVMLPAYGDFYPGSVVTLRGQGFSASDRVFVENGYAYYGGSVTDGHTTRPDGSYDDNGDGTPDVLGEVEATVAGFGDDYLNFVIPGEIVWSEATVYISRGGVKQRVGRLVVNRASVGSFYSDGLSTAFEVSFGEATDADRVYVCPVAYDDEGNYTPTMEARPAAAVTAVGGRLMAWANILGETFVYVERNGETSYAGIVYGDPYTAVEYPAENSYREGDKIVLRSPAFFGGDRVVLQNYTTGETITPSSGCTGGSLEFAAPSASYGMECYFGVTVVNASRQIQLPWSFVVLPDGE